MAPRFSLCIIRIEMTNPMYLNEGDLRIAQLREEIGKMTNNDPAWLNTPHHLLAGDSPEKRLIAGDYDSVENLLHSILYIGIS